MTIDWRPSAGAEAIRQRARLLAGMRRFFAERNVIEVQTPILTPCGVTDVHIDSMATRRPETWLRTSPEYFHKRLLAAGSGDIYELGQVFRRDEAGRFHQPEFTLLEWYRVGWDWRRLAAETVDLIRLCLPDNRVDEPVQWRPWRQCFIDDLGIDGLLAGRDELAALADDAPDGLERDALLDWLFATRIQPALGARTITVVYDYPASQAALARLRPDDPRVAERFEVFVGATELANGYRELLAADIQRRRFERDNRIRRQRGQPAMPVDEHLLAALAAGMPECSGVALGVDRLLMLALGARAIDEVVSFARRPGE
ncbi:MAG TPA: EF-P lysine aminoacylase EpmA [Wenzhouxiangella sp.]|nr:EF-P lysine aminoacylase EpmA [Wenzhouxiangella sp.]